MAQINWYPGHMAKAIRQMENDIKMVDCVCELLDARIPLSSHNPELDRIAQGKPRVVILNRIDQADPAVTDMWKAHFSSIGVGVVMTDCKTGKGVSAMPAAVKTMLRDKIESYASKGQTGRALRAMIVGIPNVGKSSLINRVAGRKAAEAANRPGVTRGRQWIRVAPDFELLDTPGVLWPKLEAPETGENLAITGAIKDDIIDIWELAEALASRLLGRYRDRLTERYGITIPDEAEPRTVLELIAQKRGYRVRGGEADYERTAAVLIDDFRSGKLGRISLEVPVK